MKKTQAVSNFFCKLVESIALIIAILAIVVIIGWIIGNSSLTRIIPHGGNMKFWTAFLFFLSSIGLYNICHIIKSESDISSVVLPGVSLVISITLVSILASKIYLDPFISIENIFVHLGDAKSSLGSGLVAYPTLLSFGLFAIACIVVLFKFDLRLLILKILGIAMMTFPLIIILGIIFNNSFLISFQRNVGVPTTSYLSALGFVLLGTGLFVISYAKKLIIKQ